VPFLNALGKLRFLRVNDLGHVYGPPDDAIYTEVTAALQDHDHAFGFIIRVGDDNLPSRLAMLSVMRDAFIHDRDIAVWYDIVEGKKNGHLRRVELSRSAM
jgi:hypothetical protein